MQLRVLLLLIIVLFSFFGYITYLNHGIRVSLSLIQGRPISTSLPTLMLVSFAAGALVIFLVGMIRDATEGWKEYQRNRKIKRKEAIQDEVARGLNFIAKGDLEKGKVSLLNALKKDPSNLEIYDKVSDAYIAQGRLKEAAEMLERGWAVDTGNWQFLIKKARIFAQMRDNPKVVHTFKEVLERDPENSAALLGLREAYILQKKWGRALRIQNTIMKTARDEGDAGRDKGLYLGLKYEYAQSLATYGKKRALENALRFSKEIIRQDKDFLAAYILLGDIYQKQNRWADAARILGRGFRVSGSAVFLLRLEDLYLGRGDHKTLLKIYRRALENNPDRTVISFLYSRLCLRLRMFSEALDELVEIKEGWEKVPAFHGLMAEILVQKGKLDDAVGEFKKTLDLADPSGLAYVCRSCQNRSTQWSGRCPSCNQWCTYHLEWEALSERSARLAS